MQSAMQGLDTIRASVALTDSSNSPAGGFSPEAVKLVPDSFAEWLAQPAQTISDGEKTEQGTLVDVLSNSSAPANPHNYGQPGQD